MGSDVSWIGCYSCRCPVRQPCTLLRTFLVNDLTNSKMHACGKSVGRRWVAYLHARAHWHLLQVSHLRLTDIWETRPFGASRSFVSTPNVILPLNLSPVSASDRDRASVFLGIVGFISYVMYVLYLLSSNVLSANFEWAIEVFQPFDPNTLEPQEIQFIKSRSSTLLQISWFSVTFPRSFIPS